MFSLCTKRVSAYKYINILYFLINQLNASVFYTQLTCIVHWDPVMTILFPEFLSNTIYRCGTVGFGVFVSFSFGFSVSLLLVITTLSFLVLSGNSVLFLSPPNQCQTVPAQSSGTPVLGPAPQGRARRRRPPRAKRPPGSMWLWKAHLNSPAPLFLLA